MSSSIIKEFFRTLKKSIGRFLSIVAIVTLGVAFYSGINATGPDMRITADKYYDGQKLFDIKISSTLGFDKDDIEELSKLPEISSMTYGYSQKLSIVKGENQAVSVLAMSMSPDSDINNFKIHSGRAPLASSEIMIDFSIVKMGGFALGDRITVSLDSVSEKLSDIISRDQYIITGICESPLFISDFEPAPGAAGFVVIPEMDFVMPVYTEVYIRTDSTNDISRFGDEYTDMLKPIKNLLEGIEDISAPARLERLKKEAVDKIFSSKIDLENGKTELADAKKLLDDGEKEYNDGKAEYDKNLELFNTEIAAGEKKLEDSQKQLDDAKALLDQSQQKYDAGYKEYTNGKAEYDKNKAEYDGGAAALLTLLSQIEGMESQLKLLAPSSDEYKNLAAQLDPLKTTYAAQKTGLEQGKTKLDAADTLLKKSETELLDAKKQLDDGRTKSADGYTQLEDGRKTLEAEKSDGQKALDDAKIKLDDAKIKLDNGKAEYQKQYNENNPKIIDAESKIAKAERDVESLEAPKWYILDPNQNISFADYKANCERIDAIARVFPLIFFLVAVLVSLTAMTRMVENERQQIGILKALGYSRYVISSKYIAYSMMAGIIGCGLGYIIGFSFFPYFIANAYGIIYHLPDVLLPFHSGIALASGIFALACVVIPAFLVCLDELTKCPANLMQPKAPKVGKRILLERLTPIWDRISFVYKVTLRNLFRYKKRLLMTIIGIAGCTALLYTGFGLRNSITSIAPLQFEELRHCQMEISIKDNTSASETGDIMSLLENDKNISKSMTLHQKTVDVKKNLISKNADLVAIHDKDTFKSMVTLRDRHTHEPVPITDDGAVITEKLADMLDVKVGDTVEFSETDSEIFTVKISGIAENYIFHNLFMTDTYYQSVCLSPPKDNKVFATFQTLDESIENDISLKIKDNECVNSVFFNKADRRSINKMIGALNYVVLVLIISAAALAVVVLMSLTSINIDERSREISTLKVLGFYKGETAAYVFREGIILSFIGAAVGLVLGGILVHFVIITAEVDMIMFSRRVSALSLILSYVMTVVFSVGVHLMMIRKLEKINMVESLKSVD